LIFRYVDGTSQALCNIEPKSSERDLLERERCSAAHTLSSS